MEFEFDIKQKNLLVNIIKKKEYIDQLPDSIEELVKRFQYFHFRFLETYQIVHSLSMKTHPSNATFERNF